MAETLSKPVAADLTPPEVIVAIAPAQSSEQVPLKPEMMAAVENQVARFVDALMSADIHSDAFKTKLDSAFRLGKEETSIASSLMTGRFMQRSAAGIADSAALRAIHDLRAQLDNLNPGNAGDLLGKRKLLGLIPFGNKLDAYFRQYESAGAGLHKTLMQIYAARDDMQRDEIEIASLREKLWDAMQKLKAAVEFSRLLDTQLVAQLDTLKATDPLRATAIEQEVLFYARQNLQDMLTQQAVCVNGYLVLDMLKRTARELQNACTRVATTGMSALAVAQIVARATGHQIQVMEMLKGVAGSVESVIAESGRQLNAHVQNTAEFSSNPLLGIEKIKEMFAQTYKAMDAMDRFRDQAIETMDKNNQIMRVELDHARAHGEQARQQ